MTEIQRLIKEILDNLQGETAQRLNAQDRILRDCQHTQTNLQAAFKKLQEQIHQLASAQQESDQNLEILSDILKNLEPLLIKLNLISGK